MVQRIMVVSFAEYIKEVLDKRTITEKELRLEFGISKQTFNKWLEGKNGPHSSMQELIFKYIEGKQ